MTFKDFAQGGVAVGALAGVTDAYIKDSSSSSVPETVSKDVSTCFVSEGVGWVDGAWGDRGGIVSTGL